MPAAGLQDSSAESGQSGVIALKGLRIDGITEYVDLGITNDLIREQVQQVLQDSDGRLDMAVLQNVASRITTIYREAGFVFTRAYIPPQKSKDGVIIVRLLEGFLSEVDVIDNEFYSAEFISSVFDDQKGKVIFSPDVEEAIAIANAYPGLNVFGFYSIGSEPGSTRINMRVREEQRWSGLLRIDNHGTDLTGNYRGFANYERFNLTGAGDALRIGVVQTVDPNNATFGLVSYERPIINKYQSLLVSATGNDFVVGRPSDNGVGKLKISGESQSVSARWKNYLRRTGRDNHFIYAQLKANNSRSTSGLFPGVLDDEQDVWTLTGHWQRDLLDLKKGRWLSVGIGGLYGQYSLGTPEYQGEEFLLLRGTTTAGRGFRWWQESQRIETRLDWQISEDIVPAVEQFSLSGANRLSGFESGEFSGDQGVILSVSWSFALPQQVYPERVKKVVMKNLQTSLFIDYGYAIQRSGDVQLDEEWAALSDVGLAFSWRWQRRLKMNLSVAKPLGYRVSYRDDTVTSARAFFDFSWQFD